MPPRSVPARAVPVHSASGVGSAMGTTGAHPGQGRHIDTVGRAEKAPSAWRSGYDLALTRGDNRGAAVRVAAGGEVDIVLDPVEAGVRCNPAISMLDVDRSHPLGVSRQLTGHTDDYSDTDQPGRPVHKTAPASSTPVVGVSGHWTWFTKRNHGQRSGPPRR